MCPARCTGIKFKCSGTVWVPSCTINCTNCNCIVYCCSSRLEVNSNTNPTGSTFLYISFQKNVGTFHLSCLSFIYNNGDIDVAVAPTQPSHPQGKHCQNTDSQLPGELPLHPPPFLPAWLHVWMSFSFVTVHDESRTLQTLATDQNPIIIQFTHPIIAKFSGS